MTHHTCPVCHALGTPSGYLPHAPLCPNGVDALTWAAPRHRAPESVLVPLTAASHVNGYKGETVPLYTAPELPWLGGAL